MESLSDTNWDVVISGTGLQQSLLALALSRSGKNVLHVDDNEFYGENEAALTLQELDSWAEKHSSAESDGIFAAADIKKPDGADGLRLSRTYSVALAPQLIHTRSELLSQLVSSKAFRQLEFQAVGSFYIYQPSSSSPESSSPGTLSRIPSTREDVFANKSIPAKSKRALMKFLMFVLEYDSEGRAELWRPRANDTLSSFLEEEFKLDAELQAYVVILTLSLDGNISVEAGLTAIHRHLTSMGVFGVGFAAVYPKWGGLSEVAQVGCRAGAVGGAVYMLGVGIKDVKTATAESLETKLEISLDNGISVHSKSLVRAQGKLLDDHRRISRLTVIIDSSLPSVFETVVEGAPTPSVAVIAFPAAKQLDEEGTKPEYPIYAMVHSSDTGECPSGQCIIYFSTITSPSARIHLEKALCSLLAAIPSAEDGASTPNALYRLYYEQSGVDTPSVSVEGTIAEFSAPPLDLAFSDSILKPVREAWGVVMGPMEAGGERQEYMMFEDREGVDAEDELDAEM